uniref:FERM and PDZ domain-containing protein 1-like n=1 Tax=Mastacembelus armatus TaxID=205130 RepID=A0A3Q3LHJ2_9TELE
ELQSHQITSLSPVWLRFALSPSASVCPADCTPLGMTKQGHFVCAGGPADGRLVPGDQLVKINNVTVDDLTPAQAAEIIRSALTVGPKSSFITPEKRAKLRSNPVKVHFAEEVEVNGHSQGNSLLFLPNVLKVYLENGQTKAFKFEPSTTVKDIVMTLREKLSLSCIEHFSLVLEQQHSISKLLLLHDEERIQQVVQKKEAHDYRCLFRVCFMPKNLQTLLHEDPTAFEYLYLQGVNDVLQERFAVEMRCNTALRLAALHIQERLASCGQSPKTNLKTITKTWGIENFVSSTLLRNMREKDLRKAISFHMKRSQSQHDSKQKGLPVDQARINYLEELGDLKSFGGKSFSATMMLQDRESMVTLLVGARYGVSQVVNHKLSILSTLTEFTSITRIELLPESDKVSLVKIYLHDIKPITLLLESVAAKDMSCLIAGYCRVFVDPNINIFPWINDSKKHRVSAEEGERAQDGGQIQINIADQDFGENGGNVGQEGAIGGKKEWHAAEEQLCISEASDSCHTDSRVLTSPSNDSLDALEEDDLLSCSSSSIHPNAPLQTHPHIHTPLQLHHYSHRHVQSYLLAPPPAHSHPLIQSTTQDSWEGGCRRSGDGADPHLLASISTSPIFHPKLLFLFLTHLTDPFCCYLVDICTEMKLDFLSELSVSDIKVSMTDRDKDRKAEEDLKQGDNIGGGRETLFQLRKRSRKRRSFMETNYTSMVSYPGPDAESNDAQMLSLDPEPSKQTQNPSPTVSSLTHSEGEPAQLESKPILSKPCCHVIGPFGSHEKARNPQPLSRTRKQEMEMEPDAMESKSVTDRVKDACPTITIVRCRVDPDGKESADRCGDGKEEGQEQEEMCGEKEEVQKEETARFLPEVPDEENEGENMRGKSIEGVIGSSSKSVERQTEANMLPTCLIDLNKNGSNGFLGCHLTAQELNSYEELHIGEDVHDKSKHLSSSLPPPPPSSPLTVLHKSQSENTCISTTMSFSNFEEMPHGKQNHTTKAELHVKTINDEDTIGISSTMTTSDEVTDSTNSDNVFDDDEVSNSLNSCSGDKKDDCSLTTQRSIRPTPATAGKVESQMSIKSLMNNDVPLRIDSDYTRAINSITLKLGAATSITSPTFDSGAKLKSVATNEDPSCSNQNVDKPSNYSTKPPTVECKDSLASPSSVKAVHELSKQPPSPTPFLFQTCSPSIMGRLSASTLRGKIQNLPLYLSRSQETVNQAGVDNVAQSPPENNSQDNSRENTDITIQITDVHDLSQPIDFEIGTAAESVDSDDSDTIVTGSEVDGEFFVDPSSAKTFHSGSEAKEVTSPVPVQTEPKPQHQNQLLYTESIKNTPGPITEPPASIVNSFPRDTSGPRIEIPGPIKHGPESKELTAQSDIAGTKISNESPSIPPPVVMTTQNLNGPGLPFYNQSQKARWTSSDRPLMCFCRSSEQNSDSPKTHSSGCKVFTICEDPAQTKTAAEVGTGPPLKSEFGCNSVLASGCESVVEGVQVPLDACGCPTMYTNCFSGGNSFDDELTIYEFSCRTQSSNVVQTSDAGIPLMTSPPVPSFLSTSLSHSPSSPHSILLSSSTSELSPLLSPLSDCFLPHMHKDTISRLSQQQYPEPPTGFQVLRVDVDQLLSILESSSADHSVACHGGRHPRDTCPAHFTENKRVLQIEAHRLMSSCQKVVGVEQSPEEMLHSLAVSFQTLVELAGICLWFSGCDRCDRRNAEAVAGLADVARSFRDFCLAAERASSKRSCQDLSIKLLAKQCTALTASVFCLTQLFRTLTAL